MLPARRLVRASDGGETRMHAHIVHNERVLKASAARLPPVTAATLHGRGVFTTVAVYGGRPFMWPRHWRRLSEHARRAGVEVGALSEESVGASLASLVGKNKVGRGRARVTLLARSPRGGWTASNDDADEPPADLLIFTADAPAPARDGGESLALTVSPARVNTHSPLAGVKSTNYLERALALDEARARDFDEAVRLNERGEVASAIAANIFWATNGTLHTPALATGAVAGVTRGVVLELAEELAVPVVEGAGDLTALGDADEIFLTSASLGVVPVTAFDFRRYTVALGSVALRLREAFRQLTLQHAG